MLWTEELLFNKAKLYMQRANAEDTESPLYPFWASLSLEFLCRAALAKVHPALLADPREARNIFYACGLPIKGLAKSIQAKTVFLRCTEIIKNFDQVSVTVIKILAGANRYFLLHHIATFGARDDRA